MEYANDSVGYEVIQTIKDGAVHSYGGFITDDYQMIGSAANNSINIYENYGNNTFFFSYSLSTGLTGIIVKLEVSEDATFLVVSFQNKVSILVFTRNIGSINFSLNQTISLQYSQDWRPSISYDHQYLVVGDRISSTYYVQIYTYNTATYQFDPPADPTLISTTTEFIYYASLSRDKNYLAISTDDGMYLYSSPLSSSPILEQTLSPQFSDHHKFSKDGKYLIFSANDNIEIVINCDYDPGTLYDNSTLSCVPCTSNCQTCLSETQCSICLSGYTLTSGECIANDNNEDEDGELLEETDKVAIALGITLPIVFIAIIAGIYICVKKPFAFQKISTDQDTANVSEEK